MSGKSLVVLVSILVGSAAWVGGWGAVRASEQEDVGGRIFREETFGGNGRMCATCHELERYGTITPELVRERFRQDPRGPLFRPIDSDDGLGGSYGRLMTYATVRVPVALDPDLSSGLAVRRCDSPRDDSVFLHRGSPTVFNTGLDGSLMVDGREGADLERQANNAVLTHFGSARAPTPEEVAAVAAFQRTLYSHRAIAESFGQGAALRLPVPVTEAETRGREFLEPDRQCGICHSGALRNRTSAFHPQALGHNFESALVGQEPDNPNPKYEWCFFDPNRDEVVAGPSGSDRVFDRPTADPGAAVLAGAKVFPTPEDRLDTIPNMELASSIGPVFKIPTLWGVANTAPYFHDNSAATLEEVVEQYNFVFERRPELARAAGCEPTRAECLDARDRSDIAAYLELFQFDGLGVRAPYPF